MATTTIQTAHAIGMGIDVSKDKLDLAVRLSNQDYLESIFTNDAKGIKSLCDFLTRQKAAYAAPLVIESTGDYHLMSTIMIKQKNFNVKLINPITTKKYQKSSIRNAKTDKIDARRLADIAVIEQELPDFKDDIDQIGLRKLTSLLSQLEKSHQQLNMSYNRFNETAKNIGLRNSMNHFKKMLTELDKQIAQTKKEITEMLPEQQKKIADETKGLSREKLAVIHAFVGDKKFDNPNQLAAFFGVDIAVRKSGKWSGKAKLSKRGNSYARKILYQIAWGMKTHNDIFRTCYLEYRGQNKHYNAILMILARKFLRYYFSKNYKCANSI